MEPILFGRYRLLERAGRGGTAQVWRARDEATGETVAVKRLHPIVFADEAGRTRLAREFETLRGLDHPNIVRVRDLHLEADEGALVLDYVDGPSLAERLAADGPLSPGAAARIATDLAAALTAAHASGVVHRDVTPGNVLLAADGRALLTDFGIARGAADATAVTATGDLVGTFRYMAPEQLRGEPATPATDQYALGAVAYEMLAGSPPFVAMTPVALAEAHASPPAPLAGLPPEVDAAVQRALAHDPADRHPTPTAFAAALTATLAAGSGPAPTEAPRPAVAAPVPAGPIRAPRPAAVPREPRADRGVLGLAALGLAGLLVLGALGALGAFDGAGDAGAASTPTPVLADEPTEPPARAEDAKDAEEADEDREDEKEDRGEGKAKGRDGDKPGKGKGRDD